MDALEVLSKLSPGLRKSLALGDSLSYEKQELPSLALTQALNGGLPYGRQVLIYGSKSSAKSSLCLQTVAMAQSKGRVAAWIDAEMSYDSEWAARLGVDTSQLIVSEARTINDMVDVGTQLMSAGVDIIVVDSISSLLPGVYFEKDGHTLNDFEKSGQMGQESKDFSRAVKMLNYANNRTKPTLLILISQVRNSLGTFTSHVPTGGHAVKFYSSVILKLFSSESQNNAISNTVTIGDKTLTENVGRKVDWLVQFSKTSPAFVGGSYNFLYKGERLGIDVEGEIRDVGVEYGVIKKSAKGGWFDIFGTKIQGDEQTSNYLRSNPTIAQEVLREVESVRSSLS